MCEYEKCTRTVVTAEDIKVRAAAKHPGDSADCLAVAKVLERDGLDNFPSLMEGLLKDMEANGIIGTFDSCGDGCECAFLGEEPASEKVDGRFIYTTSKDIVFIGKVTGCRFLLSVSFNLRLRQFEGNCKVKQRREYGFFPGEKQKFTLSSDVDFALSSEQYASIHKVLEEITESTEINENVVKLARDLTLGRGDGRISEDDASKILLSLDENALEAKGIIATLQHIKDSFNLTDKAVELLERKLKGLG